MAEVVLRHIKKVYPDLDLKKGKKLLQNIGNADRRRTIAPILLSKWDC